MLIPDRRAFVAGATLASTLLSPSLKTHTANDALILGGFLMPESGYDAYADMLRGRGYNPRFYSYNDPILQNNGSLEPPTPASLLVGHSKGAKTVASWMAKRRQKPVPSVLIEPVDVDPPRDPHFSVLELWETNQETIASVPTLIISAPFTETSKRYGKASNLCAPVGQDSRAFFEAALRSRRKTNTAAPLALVEFSTLGHNDVTSAALGGCADGPGRAAGAQAVAHVVSSWLETLNNGDDFPATLQQANIRLPFEVYTDTVTESF